jgi:RHS repeat-associated protein
MKTRSFKRPVWERLLALTTLITFLASLLPARLARASNAGALAGIPDGTAGASSLGGALPTAGSPEALATVDLSTGSARSSYAFKLPKARGDAQPSLALRYDSGSGAPPVGFAGVGWTLNLPSIVRKGHTGIPRFEDPQQEQALANDVNADDFYIDGALLIPVQLNPPLPAAIANAPNPVGEHYMLFRTEVDNGARYFFNGLTWIEQHKNGHLLQYGTPLDGGTPAVEHADIGTVATLAAERNQLGTFGIYRWNLVRDTDAAGNTVFYIWDDQHQLFGVDTANGNASVHTAGTLFLTDIFDTANTPHPQPPTSTQPAPVPPVTHSCAPNCPDFGQCSGSQDCDSFNCVKGICQPPSCAPNCEWNNPCGADEDCRSLVCGTLQTGGASCQPSRCSPNCTDGSHCGNNNDCQSHACNPGNTSLPNVCAAPGCSPTCETGAQCGANSDCRSNSCVSGICSSFCSPSCGTGLPCNNSGDCSSQNCVASRCAPPTCAPSCGVGAFCEGNGICGAGLECIERTCAAPCAATEFASCRTGSPCRDGRDCLSFNCVANKCAPPMCAPICGQGALCLENSDCASGTCSNGTCAAKTGMLDDVMGLFEKEAYAQTSPSPTLFAHHVHLTWSRPTYSGYTTNLQGYGLGRNVAPYTYSPIWTAPHFAQLATVDVFSAMGSPDRQLVREYQLSYTANATQTRSFLSQIQLVGDCDSVGGISEQNIVSGTAQQQLASCAAGESMPATTFAYFGVPQVQPAEDPGPPPAIIAETAVYGSVFAPFQMDPVIQLGKNPLSFIFPTGLFRNQGRYLVDLNGDAVADAISLGTDFSFSDGTTNICPPIQGGRVTGQAFSYAPGQSGAPLGVFDCVGPGWDRSIIADWGSTGHNSVLELLPSDVLSHVNDLPSAGPGPVPPFSSVYAWRLSDANGAVSVQTQGLPSTDVSALEFNLGFLGGPPSGHNADDFIAGRALDMDGDGLPDMTFASVGTSSAGVPGYATYFSSRDRNGVTHPFSVQGSVKFPPPWMDPTQVSSGPSQPTRAVADMDGDGVADLVVANKVVFGKSPPDFVGLGVMPNRGDGRFGVPDNTHNNPWDGYGNFIVPGQTPPPTGLTSGIHLLDGVPSSAAFPQSDAVSSSTMQNSIIRFGDLNGDGFADFALLDKSALWICLRYGAYWDSAHWRCTNAPSFKLFTSSSGSAAQADIGSIVQGNILIGDVDGSGINQVVFFTPYDGGAIVRLDGQLAYEQGQTGIGTGGAFAPSLQPTAIRVSPGGGSLGVRDGLLESVSNGLGATTSLTYATIHDLGVGEGIGQVPVSRWVVQQVTTTNGLTGSQAVTRQKNYTYKAPLYDARDRLFVGFRSVQEVTSGDPGGNSPGTVVKTTFATATNYTCGSDPGSDATCQASAQIPEAMIRASRGLVSLVDVQDSNGKRISSTVHHVSFGSPYTAVDGRAGVSPVSRATQAFLWGSSAAAPEALVPPSLGMGVSLPSALAFLPATGPEIARVSIFDTNGNETQTQDRGVIQGNSQVATDSIILTDRVWSPPPGDQSAGWSLRVTQSTTGYAVPGTFSLDKSQPFREMDYKYDSVGRLRQVLTPLTGGLLLPGPGNNPNAREAGQPPAAVLSSPNLLLSTISYDPFFGNVTQVGNQDNPCLIGITYDPVFLQLPDSETYLPNGCNTGMTAIITSLAYDRRLDVLTSVKSASGGLHISQYDDFGRIKEIDAPNSTTPFGTTTVLLADYQDVAPIRRVHVQTGSGLGGGMAAPSFTDHYSYIDGLGETRAVVDAVDPASHEGQAFVISGIHTSFTNGRVASVFRPQFGSGPTPPGTLPPEVSAPVGQSASFVYDGLGRTIQTTDFRGHPSVRVYEDDQLSVQVQDAEQVFGGSPHSGSATTITRDGHGRVISTDVHLNNANPQLMTASPEDLVTTASYQATGEPRSITQTFSTGGSLTRSMMYDSLGRLVQQTEPNVGTWTYAYDAEGRLVGTSDARGCGKDLFYDPGGRLLAADYSPCLSAQLGYSSPTITPGVFPYPGAEESYAYDAAGRLVSAADRGRLDVYAYPGPASPLAEIDRQIALPGTPGSPNTAPVYGATHAKHFDEYDVAWSPQRWTLQDITPAGAAVPLALAGQASGPLPIDVAQTVTLDANGRVAQITAAPFGTILQRQTFKADGQIELRTLGDTASTTATYAYDPNGMLFEYFVGRSDGPWLTGVAGYAPPPAGDPALNGNLTEIVITRDFVGNPTSIADMSFGNWPAGSQPLSQNFTYTDDYRLSTVTTTSAPDSWSNPYAFEQSTGSPLYPQPAAPSTNARLRSQSFQYDLRGNITGSTDDTFTGGPAAAAFFDRSLGTVTMTPGTDKLSSAQVPGGPGSLQATYDNNGTGSNLQTLDVTTATASSQYSYDWDELGRLSDVTRVDNVFGHQVTESYLYTAGGQRVQTAKTVGFADPVYTINVFDSFVLKDAPLRDGDYLDDETTEQVYLAGGLARVFDDVTRGAPGSPPRSGTMPQGSTNGTIAPTIHTFLSIGDVRGSGTFVIDKDTGELVERTSYHAYGAIDTDYRASRWESSREDDKYIGQWDNAEVGLVYLNARYYNPQLGRFISPDPLTIHGFASDPNPYAYAGGNPIANADPSGLGGFCILCESPDNTGAGNDDNSGSGGGRSGGDSGSGGGGRSGPRAGSGKTKDDLTPKPVPQPEANSTSAECNNSMCAPEPPGSSSTPAESDEGVDELLRSSAEGFATISENVLAVGARILWSLGDDFGDLNSLFGGSGGHTYTVHAGAGPIVPLGRGSTANGDQRWLPRSLREELAVEQAMQNPAAGRPASGKPLGDPRWPAADGWVKLQQTVDPGGLEEPISVHYNFNTVTGEVDDFKIIFRNQVGPGEYVPVQGPFPPPGPPEAVTPETVLPEIIPEIVP